MSGWKGWLLCALLLPLPALGQTVVEYIHTDALGSVVAVTDASGNVVERREYEPYGAQLVPALQDGPGYTGHVQDAATGLVYMQQRYYDPVIGMMLSVDPVAALSDPTFQFHRYRYASSSPYRFFDPDGRRAVAFDGDEPPPPPPPTEMETIVVTGERPSNSSPPVQTMPSMVVTGVRSSGVPTPSPVPNEPQEQYRCPDYGDRYMSHLDEYLINVGPYASALAVGLMPESMAPATGGRGPLLGSKNPLTSVPRAFGVPGAGHWVARTGAAGVGVATVGVGFYNVGVFGSGLAYAIPESPGCP